MREAADGNDPAQARAAFQRLCLHYREAIVGYMRRAGLNYDAAAAADDFLQRWLAREAGPLWSFQRGESRFRHFLSVCLRHFVRERRQAPDRSALQEATPGNSVVADDALDEQLDLELAHALARSALHRLRAAWCQQPGPRQAAFPAVARMVFLEDPSSYAGLAARHGCTVNTVKSWVLGVRREYGELFRDETKRIALPHDVPAECRHLIQLAPFRRDGGNYFATLDEFFRQP